MSDQASGKISKSLGVAALREMAAKRGLHVSLHEAEQAWQDVNVAREDDRLAASWRWLFKGHTAAESPLRLLSNSQLPAWVVGSGYVGLLRQLPVDDQPAGIEWMEGSVVPDDPDLERALVPVAPLADEQESYVETNKRGPATVAIITGMLAHSPIFRRVAVASVFINAIAILTSLFALQVYDRVVPNLAYATLWYLAAGLAVALVLDALFKFARLKMLEASKRRLDESLSLYVFERLLGLKLDRRPARLGTLVAQVRDYESVKNFFTSSTLFAIVDMPFIIMFITVIYLIGGPIAWVPTLFVIASIVLGLSVYKPIARLQRENNDLIVRRQGLLYEAVAGGEVIKSQGGEARFGDSWLTSTRASCERGEALSTLNSTVQFAQQFMQQIAYIGVIIVGVYVIETGALTMGGLIACTILSGRTLGTISQLSALLLQWHHARYSLEVLNGLLSMESDDRHDRQANTKTQPLHLSVKELAYGYPGSELPALVVPAMEIPAGERVAIIGRNGSGKSTLLKLFAAVATPTRGEIHIAGLDIESCRPGWLRDVIGYLPQDPRLFSGTLLDNLTLGMSMPDEEEIFAALEKTGLATSVRNHPLGLQLPITEGGAGMSGGQRQLVGLTRMVLQNPRIWILDEPTASLDSTAEAKILQLLHELPAENTLIFTTHKQSWLELAERVMMIEAGEIKIDTPAQEFRQAANEQQAARKRQGQPVSLAANKTGTQS